ncbi:unnamed protein product [Camellia sinensis]
MAYAQEGGFFSYLSDDFKEYMHKELNWLPVFFKLFSEYMRGGVFWSREDDELRPSTLPDGVI